MTLLLTQAHIPVAGVTIRPLESVDPVIDELVREGYCSTERYEVTKEETHQRTAITLTLKPAAAPIEVHWPVSEFDRDIWRQCVAGGLSLGAFDAAGKLVGVCLVEKREWNRTLWVWDLHITAAYQRLGIGRRLLEEIIEIARREDCRTVGLETQTTNVPAITFYRRVGFEIEGIDLSYYTNEDSGGGGQVSVFMKRRLDEAGMGEIIK